MQFETFGISADAGWGRFYSCNVSLPRTLFDAAGGFDPDFTYYYEDLDIAYRLRDAGMSLRYEPAARVEHVHVYDEESYSRRLRGIAVGEVMLMQRRPEFAPYFANKFRAVEGKPRKSLDPFLAKFAPVYLDAFEAEQELAELKAYLGDEYDDQLLRGHLRAVDAEEAAAPDELTFYRTSTAYLYDLTVFAMSGTKRTPSPAAGTVWSSPSRTTTTSKPVAVCRDSASSVRFRIGRRSRVGMMTERTLAAVTNRPTDSRDPATARRSRW
jgi:hypothetical protein